MYCGYDLVLTTTIPVNSDTFAAEFIGKPKNFIDISWGCIMREINSFAYGIIGVFLKSGLYANVIFRFYFVSSYQYFGKLFGNLWYFLWRYTLDK